MNKIVISSTHQDLVDHRRAVTDVLARMKRHYTAMEYFGSRTDQALPVCQSEIDDCEILVGIYAWRYGWSPPGSATSITEQEFDYARDSGKSCLCYLVSDEYPWPPKYIESGENGQKLRLFKEKVSQLVRATFTSPDNLAKQIAADVARELAPPREKDSVGGLLQLNWDRLSTDLQLIILDAYKRAKQASTSGVVSTRHVIAAMESMPNSSAVLFRVMPNQLIDDVRSDSEPAKEGDDSVALAEAFEYEKPFSHCVLGSLKRLLPSHTSNERLLAIEVAADILKNGRNQSVEKFRRANIDGRAVERLVNHANHISNDTGLVRSALEAFDDATIAILGYEVGLTCDGELRGSALREHVLKDAASAGKLTILAGEIMRRKPDLLA